jgi:hypothetical protein
MNYHFLFFERRVVVSFHFMLATYFTYDFLAIRYADDSLSPQLEALLAG